jgi:hypothetical protein
MLRIGPFMSLTKIRCVPGSTVMFVMSGGPPPTPGMRANSV